ncbi:MAG TPA: type 1 glutamine amidotransferase domain-containing protein [Burkholderiaceae bacterium]|nr:type 1 glutamine amidotransferase domain-containing protein [Burkholderiaceae bacterium]
MATVLMPLAARDFDPTETAVPWKVLTARGHSVRFATPDGLPGQADERMLTGNGLGIAKSILMADINGRRAYAEMVATRAFQQPQRYADLRGQGFDALVLPGGHAPGMKQYLESQILQSLVVETFREGKPVAAICHGVLLAARSRLADGRSVLFGKKTTALTKQQELSAWALTYLWLRDYYRTYPTTVQDEVTQALAKSTDFVAGPISITRDTPSQLRVGFTVRDGNYLSARWPGDAHRFASEFASELDAVGRTSVLPSQESRATGKQIA